jgi:hypothetical protein
MSSLIKLNGIGPEVNPAEHDWNNPVAQITIRRIYNEWNSLNSVYQFVRLLLQ